MSVSSSFSDFLLAQGDDLQFVAFFALILVLGIAEAIRPGLDRQADRKRRWPANLGLTILNAFLPPLVPVTAVGLAVWAEREGLGLLHIAGASTAVAVATTLLVRSLASYGTHVLMHQAPLLWRLHRVHHSDTHLDVSTTVRFHPVEFVVQLAILIPLVLFFGLSPWVLVVYELLDVAVNVFTHANVRLPPGVDRVVRWVFVTPDMHRIHHSSWRPETDSNYGAVFSFWDRAFDTYRDAPEGGHDSLEIGLKELRGPKAASLWWQLWSPLAADYSDRRAARTALEAIYAKPSEEEQALAAAPRR